jgi:hypothetical protein
MDVPMMRMLPSAAKRAIRAQKGALFNQADQATRRALRAYEAMAKGTPVISLAQVFRSVPFDAHGRPRVAIMRADVRQVRFNAWESRATFEPEWNESREVSKGSAWYRARVVGVDFDQSVRGRKDGYAMVPPVPVSVAGENTGVRAWLEKHWILWEVERWNDQAHRAIADRDPLLLKRLVGDLYAVLDSWELTDIERSLLPGLNG